MSVIEKKKHLVISGGGSFGFSVYAAIRESNKAGYWNLEDLETIYATSAGAIIAVILSLKYDWDIIDDFLLKRPWGAVFQININHVLSAFSNRGLFNKTHLEDTFAPLFGGKDISLNITLREFYEITRIELHFFACEINGENSTDVDFSYITHPEWLLLDAVYCSCCIPGVFQPLIKDNNCFVDGGTFMNYPIQPCLERVGKENKDTILGFKRQVNQDGVSRTVTSETTLLDTVIIFINRMIDRALAKEEIKQGVDEIPVETVPFSITNLFSSFNSEKERYRLFELGVQSWLNYHSNSKMELD